LKINHKLIKVINESFENEFAIDCYQNIKNSNRVSIFRPHINKGYAALVKNYIVSFVFILSFPIFPFLNSKLCRIRTTGEGSKYLITFSEKANSLYCDLITPDTGRVDINHIQVGMGSAGRKVRFPFNEYLTYIFSVLVFIKRYRKNIWFLKSIVLIPEMISLYAYLNRSNVSEIYMANQFDRWAYLLSSSAIENGCYLELRQHGVTDDEFIPKMKIPMVNKLVVYDEKELVYFESRVVDKIIDTVIIPPKLNLASLERDSFNILIAASGSYEHSDYEVTLIKIFVERFNGKVFFKPHPLLTNKRVVELSRMDDFHYISDKNYFPDVDVMIHFSSTLATEYRNTSDRVKIYNIGSRACIERAVKEIQAAL